MTATASRHGITGQRIASELKAAILDGTYAPGARIRQEDVAERFGASRLRPPRVGLCVWLKLMRR